MTAYKGPRLQPVSHITEPVCHITVTLSHITVTVCHITGDSKLKARGR